MKKHFRRIKGILFVLLSVFCVGLIVLSSLPWPDLTVEKITDIGQTLVIFDRTGAVSVSLNAGEDRQCVPLSAVSQHVIHALLATEDIRFYEHGGIDVKRIGGALLADLKAGGFVQGASTITQQLIKNSHLTNEKTLLRKGQEALLALQLERLYDKNEILEMYLNFVYFGRGAYGIEAAAQAYFGVPASDVTLSEAALLVGTLKAPGRYAPHLHPEAAEKRRKIVLEQMQKYGFITKEQQNEAQNEPISVVPAREKSDFGYYTDYVLSEGAALLGISVDDLLGGGYRVYTTLDASLQEHVQAVLARNEAYPTPDTQGAAVVLENGTGALLAMVGGREHEGMRLFNRALALRQPGSCLKPLLVYGPALEDGLITCATVLNDSRRSFDGYAPKNFRDVYYGPVTVRRALTLSLNVPAVEVLEKLGVERGKAAAEKLGIVFDETDRYLALALGGMAYGTSPLTLAGAYRALACGGLYQAPWCIEKITDASGTVLYAHQSAEKRVMKDSTAFLLTDMLSDVSRQSGNALSALPGPIVCKTGTVGAGCGGFSDSWCAAFTAGHTVTVWMGCDYTDEDHHLPDDATGSTYPSAAAKAIFEHLADGIAPFPVPESVTKLPLNETVLYDDLPAAARDKSEYFACGTEPELMPRDTVPLPPEKVAVQWDEFRTCEISVTCAEAGTLYVIYRTDGLSSERVAAVSGNAGQRLTVRDPGYREDCGYTVVPEKTSLRDGKTKLYGEKSGIYRPE